MERVQYCGPGEYGLDVVVDVVDDVNSQDFFAWDLASKTGDSEVSLVVVVTAATSATAAGRKLVWTCS